MSNNVKAGAEQQKPCLPISRFKVGNRVVICEVPRKNLSHWIGKEGQITEITENNLLSVQVGEKEKKVLTLVPDWVKLVERSDSLEFSSITREPSSARSSKLEQAEVVDQVPFSSVIEDTTRNEAIALPQSASKQSIVLDSALAPVASEPSSLNPAHEATPTSTVEVLEPLTPEEEALRQRLELKVERAFYEAGAGLRELRDRRLYRSTHKTFEQYCRERFGFERRHPYRLIEAANVMDNLCPNRTQEVPSIRTQILPTKLEQVRPLTSLEPMEQRQVWQQAVNKAGGKVPSGRIVKGIVSRLKDQGTTPPTIPYQVGDVVEIRAGANPTLRKHNGCWGIVTHVGSFSCTVHISVRDVNVQCKPDEMDTVDPKYTQKIQEVSDRVAALARCDLDPAAWSVLETLNRQTCFTQFQLDLLAWVEERYGLKTYDN